MEKEEFVSIMNSIEKHYRQYQNKTNVLSTQLGGNIDFIGGEFVDIVVRTLQQVFPPYIDKDGKVHCTIEYYMYDLDFGKRTDLSITHIDNGVENKILLTDAGKLYDYLTTYGI